ncbi:hypothetical protein PC121_g7705 [Phytophthora cactorum]|nr:hypothetical protein PC121_g7705 [Phytophthora cactorum]
MEVSKSSWLWRAWPLRAQLCRMSSCCASSSGGIKYGAVRQLKNAIALLPRFPFRLAFLFTLSFAPNTIALSYSFAFLAPENQVAKSALYQDIPKLFRWDTKAKRWVRRKRYQVALGQMIHMSPRDMQRFYMRVLLCHRKGPTSFENLRTVDGVTYDSYREAALHAGYLEDDSEWVACMTEASQFRMPYQLRQLFATIIVYSQVVEVGALWERFYDDLSLDFGYKYRSLEGNAKEEMVKFHTLKNLNDLLFANESAVAHFEALPQLCEYPQLVMDLLLQNNLIRRDMEGDLSTARSLML